MNNKAFALIAAVTSLLAAQACSSDTTSGTGGSSSTSTSDTSASSTTASATASGSTSTGGATNCMSTLPASPQGCPDTPTAEGAYGKMTSACGLSKDDFDTSNPSSLTLTAAGKAKLCATCECQQEVFNYYALYAKCTSGDAGNAAFAKNVYDVALVCP